MPTKNRLQPISRSDFDDDCLCGHILPTVGYHIEVTGLDDDYDWAGNKKPHYVPSRKILRRVADLPPEIRNMVYHHLIFSEPIDDSLGHCEGMGKYSEYTRHPQYMPHGGFKRGPCQTPDEMYKIEYPTCADEINLAALLKTMDAYVGRPDIVKEFLKGFVAWVWAEFMFPIKTSGLLSTPSPEHPLKYLLTHSWYWESITHINLEFISAENEPSRLYLLRTSRDFREVCSFMNDRLPSLKTVRLFLYFTLHQLYTVLKYPAFQPWVAAVRALTPREALKVHVNTIDYPDIELPILETGFMTENPDCKKDCCAFHAMSYKVHRIAEKALNAMLQPWALRKFNAPHVELNVDALFARFPFVKEDCNLEMDDEDYRQILVDEVNLPEHQRNYVGLKGHYLALDEKIDYNLTSLFAEEDNE
ncbi:hypothetical protein PVAG01_05780 [Phlyctema vagabunda]|uniref:Uncharacterized protein n=1 Tax=Phlyctema vagabunda TaxID=108571 RepID=A0ABR4PE87_9HELO